MQFLKSIWNIWWNVWTLKLKLISIGAVLAIFLGLWLFFKFTGGSSINEKEIQRQQQEIETRRNQELNNTLQKSNEVLGNVEVRDKQAEANTKEAINKNFTNTSMTEAEKARCRAYPQSAGCPKL